MPSQRKMPINVPAGFLLARSFGHAVRVDKDDNIWAIDKGSDMVIRFNPEGRVTMVFGRKQEASDETTGPLKHPVPPLPAEDGRFRQVTDVAFGPEGDIFISDGYINSRIAKADKDGNWIKSWGNRVPTLASSTLRIISLPTRRGTSTSRIGETAQFKCSTARASSCG